MLLQNLFKPAGLNKAYSGLKNVLGNVYRPINKVVNRVADTVLSVDDFIKKSSDHPLVRDFVGLLTNNPLYSEIINVVKDVRDASNLISNIGSKADNLITSELKPPDMTPRADPPAGSVADSVGLRGL